jgi:hypothetical protein
MIRTVDKKTGTYSDALEAIGWATFMEERGVRRVEIRDLGLQFEIAGEGDPDLELAPRLGYWFVEEEKNPAPNIAEWKLDYEAENVKDKARREFERATKSVKKKKKMLEQAAEVESIQLPDQPKPELKTAKMLASMRKGWNADRDLAVWMEAHPQDCRIWIKEAVAGKRLDGEPDFSNSQLLNPTGGKGVSSAKTQARSAGSLPSALIDPFAEWMKLRGLWQAMIPYRSEDDFKFMVIVPGKISPSGLKRVKDSVERLSLWGGVRLDIEAILRCTWTLIQNSDVMQVTGGISLRGYRPTSVIRGLHQAFFKSLGTAAALMNDALLRLPEWFEVTSQEDARLYLAVIEEAIGEEPNMLKGCLGALDEKKSDEGAVLHRYRTWLSTGGFEDLMEFHHDFGALMFRKSAARQFARFFGAGLLDQLLIRTYEGKHMLKEIIENDGFKSVARAVRNTTVYAVGLTNSKREIHFGLAQRWRQAIKKGSGEFSVELSEFVQANNWEVVYRLKGRGHQVTTADLDEVFALIEKHGEEKVGALLLAYGFSRAAKVDGQNEDAGDTAAA